MTQNQTNNAAKKTTHFGFEDVAEGDKQGMVREVFESVAAKYDIMNDAMSFGLHRAWKDRFTDMMHPRQDMHLLDVAGGTGDIGFRFLQAGGGEVTITDINEAMLREGQARGVDENIAANTQGKINWRVSNAEQLPWEDSSFDAYSIAFGIRNVTHIEKALAEAYRVLKIGGHFMCLEFSKPTSEKFSKFYDLYSFNIIPPMGKVLSGDSESYKYLVESIRKFPKQEQFKKMLEDAGFSNVTITNLSGGITAIHSGWKI